MQCGLLHGAWSVARRSRLRFFGCAPSPPPPPPPRSRRPRRIILIRHGESEGNIDESCYVGTPDWRIKLTAKGEAQARQAGRELRDIIGPAGKCYCYVSPYLRTRQTLGAMLAELEPRQVLAVREEPRIAEQQFGNFQDFSGMRRSKLERARFGRFFYRFPNGESGLDVFNRVTSFISTLRRDGDQMHGRGDDMDDANIVVCTHGLSLRLLLMRWFQISVDEFERTLNPRNASLTVMERHTGAAAGLAIGRGRAVVERGGSGGGGGDDSGDGGGGAVSEEVAVPVPNSSSSSSSSGGNTQQQQQQQVEWYELRPETQLYMVAPTPGTSWEEPGMQEEHHSDPLYKRPAHVRAQWGNHTEDRTVH